MRAKLGLERRFVLAVLVALVGSSVALVYFLIFAKDSLGLRDRVVLDSRVFGQHVRFRVLPFFYNCFATTLVLSLRLLWRVSLNKDDVLLVLDGTVVYENYLRTAKRRRSRRWGSILRESAQSAPRSRGDVVTVASVTPVVVVAARQQADTLKDDMVQQTWECKTATLVGIKAERGLK